MSPCKKNRLQSNFTKSLSKHAYTIRVNNWRNETPLYPRKGSMTLEAAVILPLTAGFFVFFLFFFRVLLVQTEVYQALSYAGRKTAAMAAVTESEAGCLATAEVFFRSQLGEKEYLERYIWGGKNGILLLESDFEGDYVDLKANYRIKFPIGFFSFNGIQIFQESKSRKWTGAPLYEHEESDWVYITPEGKAYHKTRYCNYLDLSIRSTTYAKIEGLRNKSEHKYYACEQCVAKNTNYEKVYYTNYGEAYHTSLTCSGLHRTIYKVHLNEVKGRHACSKCYQE